MIVRFIETLLIHQTASRVPPSLGSDAGVFSRDRSSAASRRLESIGAVLERTTLERSLRLT
ncbi:Hypothetical protein A7982_10863 [Minicystis rosea]|nr:Hypothetical protein A7982_10863 [Minicystis rosea]